MSDNPEYSPLLWNSDLPSNFISFSDFDLMNYNYNSHKKITEKYSYIIDEGLEANQLTSISSERFENLSSLEAAAIHFNHQDLISINREMNYLETSSPLTYNLVPNLKERLDSTKVFDINTSVKKFGLENHDFDPTHMKSYKTYGPKRASQNYKVDISRGFSQYLIRKFEQGSLDIKSFQKSNNLSKNSEFKIELINFIRSNFYERKKKSLTNGKMIENPKINNFQELKVIFHLEFEDGQIKRLIKKFLRDQLIEFFSPENFLNWLKDKDNCQLKPEIKAYYKKNRLELLKVFLGQVNKCKLDKTSQIEDQEFKSNS